MSLARTQAEMARLFTLSAARADFAGDLGAEIARFAGTLTAKRRLDVAKWLPLTAKALGAEFAPLLRATLAEPPPGSRADALAFAARLRGVATPAWIGELADYEAQFVRAWGPGAFFAVRRYRWAIPSLAAGGEIALARNLGGLGAASGRAVVVALAHLEVSVDREMAVEFVKRIETVFAELDGLAPFLMERLDEDDLAEVGGSISRMIGELDLGVLEVIYRAHPDLRPEGMAPAPPLRDGEPPTEKE